MQILAAPRAGYRRLSLAHRRTVATLIGECIRDQSIEKLAEACDVSTHSVRRWRTEGLVGALKVITFEKATDGKASRYITRPDLYPPDEYPGPPPPPRATHLLTTAFEVEDRAA